jgi:hypothetical protein
VRFCHRWISCALTILIGAFSNTATSAETASLIAERLPRIEYRGGPFLRHPRIVTITFEGDDAEIVSRLERFGKEITHTPWWRAVTEGYCQLAHDCIGEGRAGAPVRLADALPDHVHAVDIAALLTRETNRGRFDPLDSETLLLVYLPAGVTLRDAFVPRYCAGRARALHRALRLEKTTIPYAVMPRCSGEAELTAAASHEIVEATTNPDPARRGFAFVQSSLNLGFTAAGVEPVDPRGLITRDRHWISEGGFTVQRAWSNRAAAQGNDPCVPTISDTAYVALVPRQPTVRLPNVGESLQVIVQAASDRPVAAWEVSAIDMWGSRDQQQYVEVALDRSRVTAGETATVTITLRKRPPQEICLIGLVSTLGETSYVWPVAVVCRPTS